MKKIFTITIAVAIMSLIVGATQSFAQTADTVWVPSSPAGNLNNFINGDTTSTGQRNNPNRVYELYPDSVYFYNGEIDVRYNLSIIGPTIDTTHYLPEIHPAILSGGGIVAHPIVQYSGSVTLKNLYFSGVDPNNDLEGSSRTLTVSGDSAVTFTIDHCVLDGFYFRNVYLGGKMNNYHITNNIFQNSLAPTSPFYGQGFGQLNGNSTDTLEVYDNTFFCTNAYIVFFQDNSYCKYFQFEHNTVFLTAVNPFWTFQAINADIKNNIFYGTMAMGQLPGEVAAGYYDEDGQISSTVDFDTLLDLASEYKISGSDRHINVENNAYFWPKEMTDWWTNWNDSVTTAGAQDTELVTPPEWINSRTKGMFADKFTWPNFNISGNDSVEPEFPASAMSQVSKLMNYVELQRKGLSGSFNWWFVPQGQAGPFPGTKTPEWSLAYSNTALQHAGTDGKALGDLNWFPSQLTGIKQTPNSIPSKFELSQNYPNPFNPTTNIKYTISTSGFVSLKVYNILGQEVANLVLGFQNAGSYSTNFNALNLASGVYLYKLQEGSNVVTKKMMLLK